VDILLIFFVRQYTSLQEKDLSSTSFSTKDYLSKLILDITKGTMYRTHNQLSTNVQKALCMYLKNKVLDFFKWCHLDMLEMMKNRNHIPLLENHQMILKSDWTEEQKHLYQINDRAHNVWYIWRWVCNVTHLQMRKTWLGDIGCHVPRIQVSAKKLTQSIDSQI